MNVNVLRKRIDALDAQIVRLLNKRAFLSIAIGKEKVKAKKSIYAPDREREIMRRIKFLSHGPMTGDSLEAIYREIMSSSLALEKSLGIAYLGPEGSYTHMAATTKFGSQVDYISCSSILEIFQKVEQGECDYGVVPIENSTEGAVTHTLDLFVDSDLKICSQRLLKISHALLSYAPLSRIREVYSNPNVFGQCRNWLLQHLPQAEQIPVASTTQATQMASKNRKIAAIASLKAAEIYRVPVVQKNIQDITNNITRFLVIAAEDVRPTGHDRTSILFSIKDKVGALHRMLIPFYKNGLNLTKIESRPSKKRAWDYYFFVDFEGHREDSRVKKCLAQLEDLCKYLKVLGSYPISE